MVRPNGVDSPSCWRGTVAMENSQPGPALDGLAPHVVVAGFYRTCVIDAVLEHSPAEYVRRPNVPAESPTLGLTHLQFEALLTTAKHSVNRCDFALVTMLGLLGLRIFEVTGMTSGTLVKSTATACCACAARATRSCSSRSRLPWAAPSNEPSPSGPPARSC